MKNILANNKNGGTTNNETNNSRNNSNDEEPKKVEAGKRLAEYNRKKREEFRKYELGSRGDGGGYVGEDYVNKYTVGGSVIAVFVGVGVVLYYLKNNKSNLYPETKMEQIK